MISRSTVRAPIFAAGPAVLLGVLLWTDARLAAAEPAAAPDETAVPELIDLNKRAVGELKAGRAEAADKLLREALSIAEKRGLGNHDMAARTHVHLGIVAITGLNKREEGLRHFARAQRLRPDIKLTKQLSSAALLRDFEDARVVDPDSKVKETTPAKVAVAAPVVSEAPSRAGTEMDPDLEEPDVPVNVPLPLYCPTPLEGPPQEQVRLHCLTQSTVDARKVMLFYRPGDGERYTAVPMNRTKKGWFSATIPAEKVTGRALQFYVEARGDAGSLAAYNGKGDLPNVLVLKEGAPPVGVGALAALSFDDGEEIDSDEETPLQVREKEEEQEEREAQIARRAPGRFWAGLGVGTGYGWHLRQQLERHRNRQVSAGFSSAGLGHATPELGYQLTRRLALSVQTRHQYLPTSGSGDPEVSGSPPQMAHAVLLRAHYILWAESGFQTVGTASAGYGSALRMTVPPAQAVGLISSDTLVLGPGVLGPGLSFGYNFTNDVFAGLEARTLLGVPRFGALFEATAGIQYAF